MMRFDYQEYGLLEVTHICFFARKSVAKLFEYTDFRIVSLERSNMRPEDPEFSVNCDSEQDQAFLDWVETNNPEALAYQFIVKAPQIPPNELAPGYRTLDAADSVHKLAGRIGDLTRQNMKFQSQINWLEDHRLGPVRRSINRLRNKTTN